MNINHEPLFFFLFFLFFCLKSSIKSITGKPTPEQKEMKRKRWARKEEKRRTGEERRRLETVGKVGEEKKNRQR